MLVTLTIIVILIAGLIISNRTAKESRKEVKSMLIILAVSLGLMALGIAFM